MDPGLEAKFERLCQQLCVKYKLLDETENTASEDTVDSFFKLSVENAKKSETDENLKSEPVWPTVFEKYKEHLRIFIGKGQKNVVSIIMDYEDGVRTIIEKYVEQQRREQELKQWIPPGSWPSSSKDQKQEDKKQKQRAYIDPAVPDSAQASAAAQVPEPHSPPRPQSYIDPDSAQTSTAAQVPEPHSPHSPPVPESYSKPDVPDSAPTSTASQVPEPHSPPRPQSYTDPAVPDSAQTSTATQVPEPHSPTRPQSYTDPTVPDSAQTSAADSKDKLTSLQQWLDSGENTWSRKGEEWNSDDFKRQHRVDNISGWNSSRPTWVACKVISGIINAAFKVHDEGSYNGHLQPNNILLEFGNISHFGPYVIETVSARFQESKRIWEDGGDDRLMGMGNDLRNLRKLIFSIILEGKKLPREWLNLQNLLEQLQKRKLSGVIDTKLLQEKIKRHPCLWPLKHRFSYVGSVWNFYIRGGSIFDPEGLVMDPIEIEGNNKSLKKKVSEVLHNMANRHGWERNIPKSTPLERIYLNQKFESTALDLFRYIRILHLHYDETKVVQMDDGSRIEHPVWVDPGDGECYNSIQFVETLVSECFPLFLVHFHFKMIENSIPLL